jgi:ketosteroid isomerase-like protein
LSSLGVIAALEARLRAAMLAGDVVALDALLADDLLFTNQNGETFGKEADLDAHRSGLLELTSIECSGEQVRPMRDVAIVVVKVALAGEYAGQPFAGSFAYTRLWRRDGEIWHVAAGHCSSIG